MNFGTVAAVGLKCALRHGTALLNLSCQFGCLADTRKNATSRQRLSISHLRRTRKKSACAPFFHKLWCNSPEEKNLLKKARQNSPWFVLVSATFSTEFF
jgi:hypothetical protein